MISKERFVSVINDIKKYNEWEDKLYDVIGFVPEKIPSLQDTLVDLLCEIMNDNDSISDICYFIYDLEFGAKWTPDSLEDADGNPIDISTPEKLYDYLMKVN